MLIIRREQVEAFEQAALRAFENEMVGHSREFSPILCELLGEEQLRGALRQAMSRAQSYGFTNQGPIRLYVELMFLCGSHFDTDPQYPVLGELLRASDDQMQRAERIHEEYLGYLENVSGPDAINVRNALLALAALARHPPEFPSIGFTSNMLEHISRAFPQKVAYVGEQGLTVLIDEARAEARRYEFPTSRAEALIVILMFFVRPWLHGRPALSLDCGDPKGREDNGFGRHGRPRLGNRRCARRYAHLRDHAPQPA